MTGLILFLLHLVCCALIYAGIRLKVLKVKAAMMPLVIFVPVSGAICCLIVHFQLFLKADNRLQAGIEKMKIQDDIYRGILTENKDTQGKIVSLEEAMIVNDPGTRRLLMMDVLNDNPQDYVDVLLMARMNEDVEVVHYAATAMAELSKSYDSEIRRLEARWKSHPGDEGARDDYADLLKRYLAQGIAEGQMERVQRENYSQVLREQVSGRADFEKYKELTRNEMELGQFESAKRLLDEMKMRWEEEQDYQMLLVEYYARCRMGSALQEQIGQIQEKNIYLSQENRKKLEFWRKKP